MCSLCGILGCDDHWSSAVERPGVYSRNDSRLSRRREAARRLAIANKVLHTRRMKVEDFHNTSYVLRGATGATTVCAKSRTASRRSTMQPAACT